MDKEKFNHLKDIRKSLFEQTKKFTNYKDNLTELYNFNEIKKSIALDNLLLRFTNLACETLYVCMFLVLQKDDWTQAPLLVPCLNTLVESWTILINDNLKKMAYNENDLLSKSILNRSVISLLQKYLNLSEQNKSIDEKIKTFNKGIDMSKQLYQFTTNDIIDTMCDIDKELPDYEKFILEVPEYKDENSFDSASKSEDCVKTYNGVKQSTIDVLNKYGLI